MNINLSPKYTPLFEILDCWKIINAEDFKTKPKEYQKKWLDLSKVDTVLMSGGRYSGKSFAETVFITLAAKDYGHRVLFTRYTMNTTDHSISQALVERMEALNCTHQFEYANNTFESKHGEGRIFITGQKTSSLNQTAKLKSLENFSMFVTDEADEQKTFDEWDKIRLSIRALDVQCLNIMVFNPASKEHFIHTEFFEDVGVPEGFSGIHDNVMYIHTTFKDNIQFIAPNILSDFKRLENAYDIYECMTKMEQENAPKKIKKGWNKYRNVVLGGFLDGHEGLIYIDWEYGEFNDSLPFVRGLDFGFNDPDAMVKVAINHKERKIHLHQEIYSNNNGANSLAKLILSKAGHDGLVIGDAASARLINDLYHEYGINILRGQKGQGSVLRGIQTIQGYTLVVTPESINIIKALNNYHWIEGGKNAAPHHDFSDLCDAFRYAVMHILQ